MSAPELDLLLDDLHRTIAPLPPSSAAVELGKFVEAVHEAFKTALACNPKVGIDAWHSELTAAGAPVHASFYQPLHSIYGSRNLSGHVNADAHLITRERVMRDLGSILELLPSLAERCEVIGKDLVSALWAIQASSWRGLRARSLGDAILMLPGFEGAALDVVASTALPLANAGLAAGIRKAPADKRLRQYLSLIAKIAKEDQTCPLVRLATDLLAGFPDASSLHRWILEDTQLRTVRAGAAGRVNVFRVVVYPGDDGWIVTDAQVVHPAHPHLQRALGHLPIQAPTLNAVATAIVDLFNAAGRVAKDLALPSQSQDYVLQVAVPAEVAEDAWEQLRTHPPKAPIANRFLCLTVEPIESGRLEADLHEPVRAGEDVAVLWEPGGVEELSARAGDFCVLLAGPAAWAPRSHDRPALLWILDEKAAAIVTDHATSEDALQALLPDGHPQPWVEILRRVKELRLAHRTLKVFWTDRRYSPVQATSL